VWQELEDVYASYRLDLEEGMHAYYMSFLTMVLNPHHYSLGGQGSSPVNPAAILVAGNGDLTEDRGAGAQVQPQHNPTGATACKSLPGQHATKPGW
jgi:hypothetical protein